MQAKRHFIALAAVAAMLGAATTGSAQDAGGGQVIVTNSGGGSSGGSSGISLEFQGRLSLLSAFEFVGAAGNTTPVLVPPATMGIRLLDQKLFIGLGASFQRYHTKACPTGGGTCAGNGNTSIFAVSPVVTYDVLTRGAAHLYPLMMMHFGVSDLVSNNDFVFGLNLGIGLRGDIGDVISIGTEWGWGMLHGKQDVGGGSLKYNLNGFFGTVNLSARIGL